MRQIPLAIALETEPSFETFVPGANVQVLRALQTLERQGPPVYLWGPRGVGKSHLLHAVTLCSASAPSQSWGWFDAATSLPWAFDEQWDLLILDQADTFDPAQQHAAFRLFVEASTHGTRVVAAGRLPPVDLPLREDLRTRLAWGLVYELRPLTDLDVRTALMAEAHRRQLPLGAEVVDHLMTRFTRDLGSLIPLMRRLDGFSLAQRRAITIPLLKQMMAEDGQN